MKYCHDKYSIIQSLELEKLESLEPGNWGGQKD